MKSVEAAIRLDDTVRALLREMPIEYVVYPGANGDVVEQLRRMRKRAQRQFKDIVWC